jgi:hypothetical protein
MLVARSDIGFPQLCMQTMAALDQLLPDLFLWHYWRIFFPFRPVMPIPHVLRRGSVFAAGAILVALLAAINATPVTAQVFKCRGEHAPSFQAIPCADTGNVLDLPVYQPSTAERAAARAIARKERAFVQKVETERESAQRQAAVERRRRAAEQEVKAARCAAYLADADRAEEIASRYSRPGRHQRDQERRARELRDRHFTECFAGG